MGLHLRAALQVLLKGLPEPSVEVKVVPNAVFVPTPLNQDEGNWLDVVYAQRYERKMPYGGYGPNTGYFASCKDALKAFGTVYYMNVQRAFKAADGKLYLLPKELTQIELLSVEQLTRDIVIEGE